MTAEQANAVEATTKLGDMLSDPTTPIKPLPDGTVKVGQEPPWWRRCLASWVIWLQGLCGVLATIWLSLPQDIVMAAIPTRYVAYGAIAYNIITTLARLRSI